MNLYDYGDLVNLIIHKVDLISIDKTIVLLSDFTTGRKIYTIGNGGSATLAEHFAQDLVKKCFIPAIFLGNVGNLTAYANDYDFTTIFSKQLETYMVSGDILICFSSSGNSKNIIDACNRTKFSNGKIVSFTGFTGGEVKKLSNINIHVSINDYGIVETIHSLIFHYIVDILNANII